MKYLNYIFILAVIIHTTNGFSQQNTNLDSLLNAHVKEIPALNEKVSISVSNTSIQEFMRGVANSSGLNVDVNPRMDFKIINNFSNVKVKDMLVFLALQYNLDVRVIGNIITISKEDELIIPKVEVSYSSRNDLLSLDVSNEDLYTVAKIITSETGKNVVPRGDARSEKIKCYIKQMPFDDAVNELAMSNGLIMEKSDEGFFVITKPIVEETAKAASQASNTRGSSRSSSAKNTSTKGNSETYVLDVKKLRTDSLEITLEDAPIDAILRELSEKLKFNYFLSSNIEDKISGTIIGKDIDKLLTALLNGTTIAFKKTDNVYVVGEKKLLDYNQHAVIHLQNRSVDQLLEFLPSDLKDGLEVIEFAELNSLFATGPAYQVEEFESFIAKIDKVVPVILIEVVILYVSKSINLATGIQAGLSDAAVETSGTVFPGIDLTIGAGKLNEIISSAGLVNLGNVTPNFYLTLEALETQGFLEVKSTPKLSTMNGHEATLAVGNTEYYLQQETQLYGTSNPQQTTTEEYVAINAELSVKIKPFVSGDEQITLEIEVSQSDFTERISETAPPGTVNRNFTSYIRVKNQEMILLGGLGDNEESDSGSGTPFLSRIPIIKWFFSSRSYGKSDTKLSVLIRPTIIN